MVQTQTVHLARDNYKRQLLLLDDLRGEPYEPPQWHSKDEAR